MPSPNHTTHSIYRIVCIPTNTVYIGQTINPPKRKYIHFWRLRRGDHENKHLQRAFNKWGKQQFIFEIIERDVLPCNVDEREQYWIEHFDSHKHGFNANDGGNSSISKKSIPCTWNGTTYPSMNQAAFANNVTDMTMRARIKKGYTCDQDIPTPSERSRKRSCIWNGVYYKTIAEAADANGIRRNCMSSYIQKGYTCDSDIQRGKRCIWNGVQYSSVASASKSLNINYQMLNYWIKQGYVCDKDIVPNGVKNKVPFIWNGIIYPSVKEAAIAIGVSEKTMYRWRKK